MRISFGGLELSKLGASRFDLRDPYHTALCLSWPAFAAAAVALEAAINVAFALLYLARPGCVLNAAAGSFLDAFFFSLETLATVGYGQMAPATTYGHVVASAELVCGMALTAILTGLLFVRFSRPRARVMFSDQAVVTAFNGRPTLMLRLANGRAGLMTGAAVEVGVLLAETSAEGHTFRRVHELRLARARMPLFPLTWTLMHEIDQASPLAGHDSASLQAAEMRMFVAFSARDHSLGTEVRDVRTYGAEAIAFGARFADAVSRDEAGHTTADLTRLSLLEPDGEGTQG